MGIDQTVSNVLAKWKNDIDDTNNGWMAVQMPNLHPLNRWTFQDGFHLQSAQCEINVNIVSEAFSFRVGRMREDMLDSGEKRRLSFGTLTKDGWIGCW